MKGLFPNNGLFGMDESTPPGFNRINFETRLKSPASEEQLLQLIETVENHCPVLDILNRPQSVSGTAFVNGNQINT